MIVVTVSRTILLHGSPFYLVNCWFDKDGKLSHTMYLQNEGATLYAVNYVLPKHIQVWFNNIYNDTTTTERFDVKYTIAGGRLQFYPPNLQNISFNS